MVLITSLSLTAAVGTSGTYGDSSAPGSTGTRVTAPRQSYILGADISSAPERIDDGAVFVDTDGIQKNLLELLQNHGFNYVRLRTFVDPMARYGYASAEGEWCSGKAQAYCDTKHTVAFARQVKAAGMGLLLDLHYSDTWADPQKQVIPESWRSLSSAQELAAQVKAYTSDVVQALCDANACPDMVQVGNEITPGFLIHVPTAATDCFGNNSVVNTALNGSTKDWDTFATLLRAGIAGVREVDGSIRIMLHIENTEDPDGIIAWVHNAQQRDVQFDILGLSAYVKWQGPSRKWRSTMQRLATELPDLAFSIVEYNPKPLLVNEIMLELPDERGLGTFVWEPLQSGAWGKALFTDHGSTFTAKKAAFAVFDQLRDDIGLSATRRASAGGIDGEWIAEIDTPFGVFDYTFDLTVDGATLTGFVTGPISKNAISKGSVRDGELSFDEAVEFGGRSIRLVYTGKLVGEELHLTREVVGFDTQEVIARRPGAPEPVVGPYPFQNPDLPLEERAANIVSLMTLEEKVACLGTRPRVRRLGIRGAGHVEGLHGLAMGGPGGWGRPQPIPTTTFPQSIGLGMTWNPELLRRAARAEGIETRYIYQRYHRGGLVVRAPNADLGRDPRWGRTEECYGEDPFFNGTMSTAYVRGLQGDDPHYWLTAALLKHFLANSNENDRGSSSSNFDQRLLLEYYSVPFRMAFVEGGSRAFMAAYNAINGTPATVHPILRELTQRRWGVDGIICTDGGALTQLLTDHKAFATPEEAAAAAVKAGINQFLDRFRPGVQAALDKQLLTESDLDAVVKGVMRVMIRLGLLDPPERVPWSKLGEGPAPWESAEHHALAREVTQQSIVLLKNEGGLLPLDAEQLTSVAVVGPRANEVLLDWYSGTPPYTVTPLAGIRAKLDGKVELREEKEETLKAAVEAARGADVAIVVIGSHPTCNAGWEECPEPGEGKEAVDRKTIALAPSQVELVGRVLEVNPRTVVVLKASFPYAIAWIQEHAPVILHMAHNSQEEGNALADVIFGDVNPAGRLVQTWPRSDDQLPPMMDYDIRKGRTYMYFDGEPLYPYGFGLSYTTFAYKNLRTNVAQLSPTGSVDVSVDVTNTGKRAGEEVVQLYVAYPDSQVSRPRRELRGFQRVALEAGATRTVTMPLAARRLEYWDVEAQDFVVEPGRIRLAVGASSADLRLEQTIGVTAE